MTQKKAEDLLMKILENRELGGAIWEGSKFALFKTMPTTNKGDIGEDFLAALLKSNRCSNVEVVKGRRGHYDVKATYNGKEATFEVKVATQDTNGAFQFNGVRYDTQYTHLFCLGISPDSIGFLLIRKDEVGKPPHKMVAMAKGTNASFKLTKKVVDLSSFSQFSTALNGAFGNLPKPKKK